MKKWQVTRQKSLGRMGKYQKMTSPKCPENRWAELDHFSQCFDKYMYYIFKNAMTIIYIIYSRMQWQIYILYIQECNDKYIHKYQMRIRYLYTYIYILMRSFVTEWEFLGSDPLKRMTINRWLMDLGKYNIP